MKIDRIERNYVCGYCGNNFNRKVGTYKGVSDQVKCPKCNNFLKTWL